MDRVDSSSDMVEVDIDMEGEMNNFIGTPRGSQRLSSRGGARPAVGVMWLFLWNAVLPLAIAVLTTANAVVVNHNATFLPWLNDGHNLGLLHAAMFVLVLGLWFAVTAYHRRARARGYLTFYRRTRGVKDAPLLAIGVGNAVLLVMSWVIALDGKTPWMDANAWAFIAGLNYVEFAVATGAVIIYAKRIREQNKTGGKTDVETQLRSHDSPLLPQLTTSNAQEQADLISLLRSKEKNLSQEVLFLRGKLSDYESSGAINDVLEARQQQCRILEQKEEDLLELVRTLESDLHTTQKECAELSQVSASQQSHIQKLQILLDIEQETNQRQEMLLAANDIDSLGLGIVEEE